MGMDNFKNGVTEDTRVRGARFNVDFQTAQTDVYREPSTPQSPKSPVSKLKASRSSMRVLALDAFGKGRMDEIRELKAMVREKDELLKEREARIARLKAEVKRLEQQGRVIGWEEAVTSNGKAYWWQTDSDGKPQIRWSAPEVSDAVIE